MAEIKETDRYNDSRDPFEVCSYCESPVNQSNGAIHIGLCARHEAVFEEDKLIGLHVQNRLKEIILRSKQ